MKEELKTTMCCPNCHSSADTFLYSEDRMSCPKCSRSYPLFNEIPIFLDKEKSANLFQNYYENRNKRWANYEDTKSGEYTTLNKESANIDFYRNPFRTKFKRLNRILNFMRYPYVPVWQPPTFYQLHEQFSQGGRALHLGGGETSPNINGWVNIDILPYKSVDVVGDAHHLPCSDNTFDLIVSNSVLEHIVRYQDVIAECHRVLKPGGHIWLCVPQMCGRHHTFDYWRWTLPGLKEILKEFEIVAEGARIGAGPLFSTLMEASLEAVMPRLSFLREIIRTLGLWLTFPLRFIDRKAVGSEMFYHYAHTIYVVGKKS